MSVIKEVLCESNRGGAIKALITLLSFFLIITSFAGEKAGVTVPEKVNVAAVELLLNGQGIRRGTLFNFKVYVGSLYLSKKSQDIKEVLGLDLPKQIRMNFLRDVDSDSLNEAWAEGFKAAVPQKEREKLKNFFHAFIKSMDNIRKKEAIILNFLKKGVEVTIANKPPIIIGNEHFAKALFSIWFINARDEDLRDGMLGKI